jgi:hypothetical protein
MKEWRYSSTILDLGIRCPSHFTPSERASDTHQTEGWVDPRAGLNTEKRKILTLLGIKPQQFCLKPITILTELS